MFCMPTARDNAIAAVYLCSNCSRTIGKSAKRRVLVHSLMLRWTQGHGLGSEPGHGSMSAGIVLCHKILTRNFNGVSSNQHNFVMNDSLRKIAITISGLRKRADRLVAFLEKSNFEKLS